MKRIQIHIDPVEDARPIIALTYKPVPDVGFIASVAWSERERKRAGPSILPTVRLLMLAVRLQHKTWERTKSKARYAYVDSAMPWLRSGDVKAGNMDDLLASVRKPA